MVWKQLHDIASWSILHWPHDRGGFGLSDVSESFLCHFLDLHLLPGLCLALSSCDLWPTRRLLLPLHHGTVVYHHYALVWFLKMLREVAALGIARQGKPLQMQSTLAAAAAAISDWHITIVFIGVVMSFRSNVVKFKMYLLIVGWQVAHLVWVDKATQETIDAGSNHKHFDLSKSCMSSLVLVVFNVWAIVF